MVVVQQRQTALHRPQRVPDLYSGEPIVVTSLIDDTSFWGDLLPKMKRKPMRGRAFKVVLALDGMPRFAGAQASGSSDEEAALQSSAQFRIAPNLDYIDVAS